MQKNDKGKYFHIGKCYEDHLSHRKFVEDESKKWDELYQYIKDLHGLPPEIPIPTHPITRLQALRNGDDIVQGKKEKRYKMGVDYSLLLAAYRLKEDDIKWFIHNVLKGSMEAKDINACLTLALKGLSEAWRLEQMEKKREAEKEKSITATKEVKSYHSDTPATARKKHDALDISDLL